MSIPLKGPATLSSSLLVRKGEATPSTSGRFATVPPSFSKPGFDGTASNENFGDENVGFDAGQAGYDARSSEADHHGSRKRAVGAGSRIAMTVRLDHETHRRLRLLSALTNKSSQEIFMTALDTFMKRTSTKFPSAAFDQLINTPQSE